MSRSIPLNYSPKLESEKHELFKGFITKMQAEYPDKIFIIPTSLAVTKAAVLQVKGKLPGVESLHKSVTGKERFHLERSPRVISGPGLIDWKAMSSIRLFTKSLRN